MRVHNSESIVVPGPAAAVFEYAADFKRLPELFRGWGPVPGIERAELVDPPGSTEQAVGMIRRIHNTDGSSLDEEILALDAPTRHTYRLFGSFQGLAKILVTEGLGDWTFEALGAEQTRVIWRYEFELTSPLALPLAVPMMKVAFSRSQIGTLRRLAAAFESR